MLKKFGVLITIILSVLSLAFLLVAGATPDTSTTSVQPPPSSSQEKQTWNLNDADIRSVIHQVSTQVGKNFIVDPRVKGKVSLISSHPLSPDELYQMFLSMLQVNGYSVITQGSVTKIIPEMDVRGAATPVSARANSSSSDEVIVQVIKIRNVPVKSLINVLRPFMPKASGVEEYTPSNDLIVTASKASISRIREIISRLDRQNDGNTDVIKLRYATPIDMVTMLQASVGQDPNGMRNQVSLAADERTNSVIISSDLPQRLKMRAIVSQLDVPANNYGDIQVIYMRYIEAKDVAPILANIIGQYVEEHKLNMSAAAGQQYQSPLGQAGGGVGSNYSFSSMGGGGRGLSALANRSNGGAFGGGNGYGNGNGNGLSSGFSNNNGNGSNSNFFSDDNGPKSGTVGPFVQWEQTTNSVIVKAPPPAMRTIKSVIAQLDIRRPQVLVDVIIAEVDVQRSRELGVEWNTGGDIAIRTGFPPIAPVTQITGGLGGPGFATTGLTPQGSTTSVAGAVSQVIQAATPGNGITIGFINHGDLRAILRALSSDSASNIVATPNLVTLDNEIANIKVGDLISFSTGTTNNYNQGGVPFTSFDRQEVGLSLTIKPQITQAGTIKLKIENDLSNIIPGVTDGGGNPRTTERVITTNVMVDNGQILVLGGLLQNDWSHASSKVPVLGDIPILGALFRSNSKQAGKKNLMIFLRPIILRDSSIGARLSSDKYAQIRQELLDSRTALDQPYFLDPVTIPPLDGKKRLPPPYPMISEK